MTPVRWAKPVWYSPFLLLLPLLALGWWREFRGAGRFGTLYFLFFVGILLLWPFDEGSRLLLPVAPLLWLYGIQGGRRLIAALRPGWTSVRALFLGFCVTALLGAIISWRRASQPVRRQDLSILGFWILAVAAAAAGWSAVVATGRTLFRERAGLTLRVGVALFVIGTLVELGPLVLGRARGDPPDMQPAKALWEGAAWLRANTPPDAVIQTTNASRIHFATGRPAVGFPETGDSTPFLEVERRYHPRFALILESDDPDLGSSDQGPFVVLKRLFPGRWRLVHHFDGGSIYESR